MRGSLHSIISGASERATRTSPVPVSLFGLGDDAIRHMLPALPVFGAHVPRGWRRGAMITMAASNGMEVLGELARTKPGAGFGKVDQTHVAIYYPVEVANGCGT